jgi:hypothetical protein
MRTPTKVLLPLLLAGTIGLAACGGGDDTSTAAATTASTAAPSASTAASGGIVAKVSANDAPKADIAAALSAAGVDNADRWADEVVEYRPYTPDGGEAHLRDELAKYNPGADTVDAIVGALDFS